MHLCDEGKQFWSAPAHRGGHGKVLMLLCTWRDVVVSFTIALQKNGFYVLRCRNSKNVQQSQRNEIAFKKSAVWKSKRVLKCVLDLHRKRNTNLKKIAHSLCLVFRFLNLLFQLIDFLWVSPQPFFAITVFDMWARHFWSSPLVEEKACWPTLPPTG